MSSPHSWSRRGRVAGTVALLFVIACAGESGPEDPGVPPDVAPAASHLIRLTHAQYEASIHDVLGEEIVVPGNLEPDTAIEGMRAIGASRTSISPLGVERYEDAAYDIAEQALEPGAARDAIVPCTPSSMRDDDCARETLRALGRRLWRRPLSDAELDELVTIAGDAASALGDFHDGLELAVGALLQSPHFLFRVELGEPDPNDSTRLRYDNWEVASRLSYFLWNTTPDDELLDAAERGELITDDGLRVQAERLLASPRARDAVRAFFTDLYRLYELDDMVKDPTVFTHMSDEVGPAAREETLRVVEDLVFEQQGDYLDLFTTGKTFVNRKLASIYNVRAPERDGFGAIEWAPNDPRRGLLTQLSFLALNSHPVASSATLRGKFIRRVLLCGTIPPPPTNVDTSIPEPSEDALTLRDRVKIHLQSEVCSGCHLLMDPIGLGLENFDALGRYRTHDNGALIDPSGDVDDIPFADAVDLGRAVREHPDTLRCMVQNMYRYANARLEDPAERALIDHLTKRFEIAENRILDLMLDVVMSSGFRTAVPAPEDDPEEGGA